MNVKLNPARMVESVRILLPTIPVNVQVNLWEKTANRVSITCFDIYFVNLKKKKKYFHLQKLLWNNMEIFP